MKEGIKLVLQMKQVFLESEQSCTNIKRHITDLIHSTKGLFGMLTEDFIRHFAHHLENFGDLEYVKMLGGNEEYLAERKVIIQEYKRILELSISTIKEILKEILPLTKATPEFLKTILELIDEMQRTSLYYKQLQEMMDYIYIPIYKKLGIRRMHKKHNRRK